MKRVFSRLSYIMLAAVVGITVFVVSTMFTTFSFVFLVIADAPIHSTNTMVIIGEILVSSFQDLTAYEISYLTVTAVLIGINVSLLVFYFRMFRTTSSVAGTAGFAGSMAAMLGFGCAACGSLFITTFLGTTIGTGLWTLLPYGGLEIGIVGLALLLTSTSLLVRAINRPVVCPI
jgi:hypothetical protein